MASCAVFDGNDTSFTCGEIQDIAPPLPKKYYHSDRFPLRSGSLVKTVDKINKVNNDIRGDKLKNRHNSRSSYRSINSDDVFRNVDINGTEEHFLPRKQRLNTVSEETGSSRRHDASVDESRAWNKPKPIVEANPMKEKRKASMELYPAPRCRDLESTKDTSFRGKPRFQSMRESDPNRPRRRRRREKEVNDENSIRRKSRLSDVRKEPKKNLDFRRVIDSDDDYENGRQIKPNFQHVEKEERKPLRRRDRELHEEPRGKDRRRRNFNRDETETPPTRFRDSNINKHDDDHRGKDKFTFDRDETLPIRCRDTNIMSNPSHPRGKDKMSFDRDLITSNRCRDTRTMVNDPPLRGKERLNFDRDIPTPNRCRDNNSVLGNRLNSRGKERLNYDRDATAATERLTTFDRDQTLPNRCRDTNSVMGNELHPRGKERFHFEKETLSSRRKEQPEVVRNENFHRARLTSVDSDDSDDAFTPRSRMMKELPKKKDHVKNDVLRRDSDFDENDDKSLPDERMVKSSSPPVRPKKYDYQSEILRLQKKMSKLQGKVTLLQKRVTHLQGQ